MPGLYEALLGTVGNENDYLAQDPYYGAARQIASFQPTAPRNNTEAFLMPLLQTGISTALAGYGKRNALDEMYGDTRSVLSSMPGLSSSIMQQGAESESPASQLLSAYAVEDRPEGWTAKTGKADLAKAILTAQIAQEAEAKQQAAREELAKTFAGKGMMLTPKDGITLIPGYAQAVGATKAAELQAESIPGLSSVPAKLQADAVKEIQAGSQLEQTKNFIKDKFEEAKKVGKVSGAIGSNVPFVTTYAENAFNGIGDSLLVQVDTILGREMNSDVRARMLSLAPKWYDSEGELKRKEKDIIELISSLSPAQPILKSAGLKPPGDGPDLSAYTPEQIEYMKSKGIL